MKLKELLEVATNVDYNKIYINGKRVPIPESQLILLEEYPKYAESKILEAYFYPTSDMKCGIDILVEFPFDEKKWVKNMVNEFLHKNNNHLFYTVYDNLTFIINTKNPRHIGYAKCKSKDTFNVDKGLAIAWARYKHYDIPKEL